MNKKGFTLIELLVVVAIMGIIIGIGIQIYTGIIQKAECSENAEQHRKVVNLANETYSFCRLNGSANMNIGPGYGCQSQANIGMTAQGVDSRGVCIRKWDCKSDWLNRPMTAGMSADHFTTHARAEFGQPPNTSGFIRGDQWQNFLKPNYPEREGITNIREKGDDLHIATFLGEDCSNGNFSNSGGGYKVDEIKWP